MIGHEHSVDLGYLRQRRLDLRIQRFEFRDVLGGRSNAYEKVLRGARETAIAEMTAQAKDLGCNAVVGVDIDYETIGSNGSMMMVSVSGTAVVLK